jgi:hypothetical protein
MITSAAAAASAGVFTATPSAWALGRERLPGGRPTTTSIPLSFRLSAWACPWLPYPMIATFFPLSRPRSASPS